MISTIERAPTRWGVSVVGFALASALLLGFAWFTLERVATLREASSSVEHTLVVREEAEGTLSLLKDAETGQRGYVITGQAVYLEFFEPALSSLPSLVDRLRRLTADNPRQHASIVELDGLIQRKASELREVVRLRRDSGVEAAASRVATGEGRRLMDEIRRVVASIKEEENRLLATRKASEQREARSVMATSLGGLASAVVLLRIRSSCASSRWISPSSCWDEPRCSRNFFRSWSCSSATASCWLALLIRVPSASRCRVSSA